MSACVIPFFYSCDTAKGYIGDTLPKEETAILDHQTEALPAGAEGVAIYFVNSISVGSYTKGWPNSIYLKSGTNIIEAAYFNSHERAVDMGGGLIQGAINSEADKKQYHSSHQKLSLDASAGHSYIAKFYSPAHSYTNAILWIEDENSGDVVSGRKPNN